MFNNIKLWICRCKKHTRAMNGVFSLNDVTFRTTHKSQLKIVMRSNIYGKSSCSILCCCSSKDLTIKRNREMHSTAFGIRRLCLLCVYKPSCVSMCSSLRTQSMSTPSTGDICTYLLFVTAPFNEKIRKIFFQPVFI